MSIFIDTGVFYAHHDRDASRHEAATTALQVVAGGSLGTPFTSDYIVDEAITLTQRRVDTKAALAIGNRILGRGAFPAIVRTTRVDESVFDDALEVLERFDDHSLSFTDATTIALLNARNIDAVLSFDDDFDGIVDRVDPESVD